MFADSRESAARETNLWSHIRRTEQALDAVNAWDIYFKTLRFIGKPCPVEARSEAIEELRMLATNQLVRLKNEAALAAQERQQDAL